MNDHTLSIGPLMKAARKFKKFNQADVANAIGCSQSALSKMEHNLLVPSAPQWFLFARFTAIPPESLESGFIDRHAMINFNDQEVSKGFKIPKRYRHFRGQKVREIYPFMKYLEQHHLPELGQFVAESELDREFFLDFDNLVNFQLILDAIKFMQKLGKTSPEDIRQLAHLGHDDIYWDHFGVEWKQLATPLELLREFSKEQVFFQADFQLKLKLMDHGLLICYVPENHLKEFSKTHDAASMEYLNLYRKFTLENLIERELGKKVQLQTPENSSKTPFASEFLLPV
jgi:transcriptional regulator with XRE-family HTH domain